jgi:hypothetical protein
MGREYWMVGLEWTRPPDWPKLELGHLGWGRAVDMKLLGVMRALAYFDNGQAELRIAWGDKQGRPLGWEIVADMSEIHEMDPESIRQFDGFEDWEIIERTIRFQSMGKEL